MNTPAKAQVFATADDLGKALAGVIANVVARSSEAGRRYLLGCPGGRTPAPIFAGLARLVAAESLDCSGLVIVMMDEYLDPTDVETTAVSETLHHSCRGYAKREIRDRINAGLPPYKRIRAESVWMPEPHDPAAYDERIKQAGGIDLFIVASGASDGHVAFCGPGAELGGHTSIVHLAETTRADNTVTFPDFESVQQVPTRGVSVGLGTIRLLSRSVTLVLTGTDKRLSAQRVLSSKKYDPDWPATFIHNCPHAQVLLDSKAAAGLRIT